MSDELHRALAAYNAATGPIPRTAKRPFKPALKLIEPPTKVVYERPVADHEPCGGLCCKHRMTKRDTDED